MPIRYLDGPRLRRALLAACDHAQGQRAELNRINVFPVPDGDTGTNLALTLQAIADHLRPARHSDVSVVAYQAAEGAVVGARGNCGMMLSHFLLGFAEGVTERARISTQECSVALTAGAEKLTRALERPVEGTILTVMRDAADAARRSEASDFASLVDDMVVEARRSLAGTPDLLPVLKKAGVVDAGAKGFVSLLEGVHRFVHGDPALPVRVESNGSEESAVAKLDYGAEGSSYRFCTEALVRGAGLPSQEAVRQALGDAGDSLIVIRAADILKLHVHTDDPERVFSYLRSVGKLVTHKAEDMKVQHATIGRSARGHVTLARRPVAIVTDSAADLPEEQVRAHGIHVTPLALVEGDRTYRDGIDLAADEFHARLRDGGELPTTSQPTPAAFLETYARAFEEAESVVAVLVSSTLSGTLGAGQVAASRADGGSVHVVDSLGASLLEGLLVLEAAELAELGTPPDEIVAELKRVRARSGIAFTVGEVDRLIASGRVTRGQALIGRALALKPILGILPDGRVDAFGTAVGTRRARAALLRVVRERVPGDARRVRFGIVHVGVPDVAEVVARQLRGEYGEDVEILTAPATPVIATHTGIGTVGVAFLVKD